MALERLPLDVLESSWLDSFEDRVIFQTREWLQFVAETQRAEPVIAAVNVGGTTVGAFTGLTFRRSGLRILGSPFPGWTTSTMGFNLPEEIDRRAACEALVRFAFGPMHCLHLELKDRRLAVGDLDGLGFDSDSTVNYMVDLARDEDAIFDNMSSACRRAVRKAEKSGVRVEEACGEDFADEYHAQLVEVFARQGLVPTYSPERVRALIRHLEPTGRLLLLRAVDPDGRKLATGIFPAYNGTAYFWGGASHRDGQSLRPNEAIFWYAMRYWRSRQVKALDLGGGGDYKLKYGPTEFDVPFFRRSRFAGMGTLRELARRKAERRQARQGKTHAARHRPAASLVRP